MRSTLIIVFMLFVACNTGKRDEHVRQQARDPKERLASWQQLVKESKRLVKDGDLITRTSSDMISASFANFNKQDKTYSHSGIAFIEDKEVYVYHTMAGDENPSGRMIKEPFDSFCNPTKKSGFGIFHYDLSPQEKEAFYLEIKKHYENELMFDTKFDLKDDHKMYCAEIIYKGLKKSTNNRVILPTSIAKDQTFKQIGYSNRTISKLEYVAIDNLYMNPYCKEIIRVKFE